MIYPVDISITGLPEQGEFEPYWKDFWMRNKIEAPKDVRVSYYYTPAGAEVPWHIDNGPTASFNIVLKGTSPVRYESGDYSYTSALLDVSKRHMVPAGDERLILKISSYRPYEEVKNDLASRLQDKQDVSYTELLAIIRGI